MTSVPILVDDVADAISFRFPKMSPENARHLARTMVDMIRPRVLQESADERAELIRLRDMSAHYRAELARLREVEAAAANFVGTMGGDQEAAHLDTLREVLR